MKPFFARYLYSPIDNPGFAMLLPFPAYNTREGHDKMMLEWTNRDYGKYYWAWERVDRRDIDYPKKEVSK